MYDQKLDAPPFDRRLFFDIVECVEYEEYPVSRNCLRHSLAVGVISCYIKLATITYDLAFNFLFYPFFSFSFFPSFSSFFLVLDASTHLYKSLSVRPSGSRFF